MSTLLQAGAFAPAFELADNLGAPVTLAGLGGKPVVLAFYPADWSPVCGDQMALYNEVLPMFRDLGAELLGVSVDSRWCHAAFAENRRLRFRAAMAHTASRMEHPSARIERGRHCRRTCAARSREGR